MAFLGVAAVMYILIDGGFDALARVQVGAQSLPKAVSDTSHYLFVEPLGLLLPFAPFAAVAWICGSLARISWQRAIGLFAVCMVVFAYMYFVGHSNSQLYMQHRKWTAASLAVGLIPFWSIPIVLIAFGLRFALARAVVRAKA
jgi:biotin transporter BioY